MSESKLNEDGQNEQQRQQQQQQQQDPLSRSETSASSSKESSPDESTIREDKEENDNKHSDKHADNNHNNNKNNNKKSKKRKRGIGGKDIATMILELRQERYDKLLYMARKQLHKQAKQVRTFLIQKSIRKQKEQQNQKPKVSSSSTAGVPVMIPWKELPLDEVVQQALKQLGILHANPNPDSAPTIVQQQQQQRTVSQEPIIKNNEEEKKRQHHDMIQQCLSHKRFQKTLEEWNVKVTDYRRWSLQLDEKHNNMMVSGKKNKNSANICSSSDFVDYRQHRQQQPTSMFCSLGGEGTNEDGEIDPDNNDNEWSAYGPGASMDAMFPKKKNRKGQRARKAKALALEAKREGNKEYQSLNWRSGDSKKKKNKKKESDQIDNNNNNNKRSENNHSNNRDASEREVEAHPSWVAKKEQQTGIVAFQGTKITFD